MRSEGWRRPAAALLALALFGFEGTVAGREPAAIFEIAIENLPPEAQQTLQLIKRGGPYPYQRDGVVFGNYERRLPQRNRGYYREFTVSMPGAKNRGARRIIEGRDGEYYYTDDHYRSFWRIRE